MNVGTIMLFSIVSKLYKLKQKVSKLNSFPKQKKLKLLA